MSRTRSCAGHAAVEVTDTATLSRNGTDPHYDGTKRYLADNMSTHAHFDDLWPNFQHILNSFPAAPTHLEVFNWSGYQGQPERPSPTRWRASLYYALYAGWTDPADDERYTNWVTEHMRAWEPYATGIQLADENLINRSARFVTDDNLRRLDELRTRWDPDGLFVSWLGRPDSG